MTCFLAYNWKDVLVYISSVSVATGSVIWNALSGNLSYHPLPQQNLVTQSLKEVIS